VEQKSAPYAPIQQITGAMTSSWEMAIKDALWRQRVAVPGRPVQNNFSLAVPILAQTLANAYAACHGNRHLFALTIQRMCVVEKTKAFFMVRSSLSLFTGNSLTHVYHHRQHVVHTEWHSVQDMSLTVFQIIVSFWMRHLPMDENMMLTFCNTIAHVMEKFGRVVGSVYEEESRHFQAAMWARDMYRF